MIEKKIYSLSHTKKLMNLCLRKIEEIGEDITLKDVLRANPYKNQTLSGKARQIKFAFSCMVGDLCKNTNTK